MQAILHYVVFITLILFPSLAIILFVQYELEFDISKIKKWTYYIFVAIITMLLFICYENTRNKSGNTDDYIPTEIY